MNINKEHAQYRLAAMAAEDVAIKHTRMLRIERANQVCDMRRYWKLRQLIALSWEIADVANRKAGEAK